MFQTLRNAWKIEDLRKKLLFTLLILVIVRLGCAIPVPFLDPSRLQEMLDSTQGNLLGYLNLLTGGAFAEATLFALGVSPYITASIVIQLLTVAIPSLERMAKEGPEGQKKIKKITRYSTIGLAILQAYAYYTLLRSSQFNAVKYTTGAAAWISGIAIVLAFSAGAMLVVWLGERIDEKGIGNGISLIIFTGIISRWDAIISLFKNSIAMAQDKGWWYYLMIPGVILFVLAATFYVVFASDAERRVPVQYAGKTIGSKSSAGQSSYIPLKLIMSGVMPIIFSSTICSLPSLITMFMDYNKHPKLYLALASWNSRNWVYDVVYIALIFAFNLFYIDITFDPIEMANNLRKNGGSIPGIRPGRTTSDYLRKACHSLAGSGAFVLSVIACVPILATAVTGLNMHFGGTSLLIVTGVALEVIDSLNSQLVVRHHKGFLY